MSFKRDESDPGPLGALQKRRVAELLASAIPEDEALLLRDGRTKSSRISGVIPKNSQTPPEPSRDPGNPGEGVAKERREGRKGNSRDSEGCRGNSRGPEGPSAERLRILRHQLHLRSQGWLQDAAGNWLKDENAEFDSDEEEPPPLPPP